MFEELGRAVERVEIPACGEAIAEVAALIDRLNAKLAVAVGEYEAGGEWAVEGATSATAWLRSRVDLPPSAAAALVRTGRRLRQLPATAAAWLDGSLTGGQVQVITANVDDRTLPQFVAQEESLLPTLAPLSLSATTRAMRFWRARAEALVDDGGLPRAPERSVHLSQTLGGRWVLDGDFDAEGGTLLANALRFAATDDVEGEPARTPAQRRGDALVDIARFYLERGAAASSARHRPHLNVVVTYDDLTAGRGGELVDGGHLDGAAIRRLLCDASVHRVVTDGRSTILDYGTSTRTVLPHLWNALVVRDRHCRHPGCDRPSRWCEAHHVVPVLEGGPTNLENLLLKCSRHHHIGHQPGWREELLPDGTLVLTDPAGRTRSSRPPGLMVPLMA